MTPLDHETVVEILCAAGFRADVRGEGAARFVYAESLGRAVEISTSVGGIWVEYWNADDSPMIDRTFPNPNAAIADVRTFLSKMM
jgi:hypothetical protein